MSILKFIVEVILMILRGIITIFSFLLAPIWRAGERAKNIFMFAVGTAVLVGICYFCLVTFPILQIRPGVTLNGSAEMTVEYEGTFEDPGATAIVNHEDATEDIRVNGEVNTNELGTYELKYYVYQRRKEFSAVRTVNVVDTTAPTISLNGDNPTLVDSFDQYEEPGALATDNYDQNVDVSLSQEEVNDYTMEVTYEATDSNGNTGTEVRTVWIREYERPTIELKGDAEMTIQERETFDDPGVVATDNRDGDISDTVEVEGFVDIYRPGTYTVTYTAKDSSENTASVKRQVTVERVNHNPDNATYLTFDDGPSSDVTVEILDILKENNIKATFFICDYTEAQIPILQRMIDEGHTIGIHGYSHDYETIYQDADTFMRNIQTLHDKLLNDLGYDAFVIRFPGGSGNTVSTEYCEGVMSELVQRVTDAGYMYEDWNVSSGDAEGQDVDTETLIRNVESELYLGQTSVVLMHDTSEKQTTVDALQTIIDYCNNNGFNFYPIEENTVPIHQTLAN